MTRSDGWKAWFAVLNKLKENGHNIVLDKPGECAGDYVNAILKALQ